MFIWKNTIKEVPNNLLHGVGVDNFLYAFNNGSLEGKEMVYDKAHNEYLQILITEGIFSFISYLMLYTIIIIRRD